MNNIHPPIPPLTHLFHRFKSLRSVPFRRKWFVGYDLQGNTYWEFRLGRGLPMRRAIEYRVPGHYLGEYTGVEIPPRWEAWLRRYRNDSPSLGELIAEQKRIEKMKVLGAQADAKALKH